MRKLFIFLGLIVFALSIAACSATNGKDGKDGVDSMDYASVVAASKHGAGDPYPYSRVDCRVCHKSGLDPLKAEAFSCGTCHAEAPDGTLVMDVASASKACAKCHGSTTTNILGYHGSPRGLGATEGAHNFHGATGGSLSTATCAFCHDPHSLAPRHEIPASAIVATTNASGTLVMSPVVEEFGWKGCGACHADKVIGMAAIRDNDSRPVGFLGLNQKFIRIKDGAWDNATINLTKYAVRDNSTYAESQITGEGNLGMMADNKSYWPNRHTVTKGCGYSKGGCHILAPTPFATMAVTGGSLTSYFVGMFTSHTSLAEQRNTKITFTCTTCHVLKPNDNASFALTAGHAGTLVDIAKANIGCGYGVNPMTGAFLACHARGSTSSIHTAATSAGVAYDNGSGFSASGSRISFQYQLWDTGDNLTASTDYTRANAEANFDNASLGSLHKKVRTAAYPNGVTCADCHDPHFVNRDAPSKAGLTKGCFDAGCHASVASNHSKGTIATGLYSRSEMALNDSSGCAPCHSATTSPKNIKMKGNLFHTSPNMVYDGVNKQKLNYTVTYPNGVYVKNLADCQNQFDNTSALKLPIPANARIDIYRAGACLVRFD